jgi:DNA-binding MarR family transcriptional regulator
MSQILQQRIGASEPLPATEALPVALGVAAGDVGVLLDEVLARHGLTQRQYHVLRMLRGAEPDGLAHAEIGQRLLTRAPDVTRLMDQLVDRGWAARARSGTDARVAWHRITADGAAVLRAVSAPLHEVHGAVRNAIGTEAADQLIALCERVIAAVAEHRRPVGRPGGRRHA